MVWCENRVGPESGYLGGPFFVSALVSLVCLMGLGRSPMASVLGQSLLPEGLLPILASWAMDTDWDLLMILLLAWHVLHGCAVGFASGTKGGLLPLWLAWGCAVHAGTGQNVSRSAQVPVASCAAN